MASYPTGRYEIMGENLRLTAKDGSRHLSPIRPDRLGYKVGIVVVSFHWNTKAKRHLRQSMSIAEALGIDFVLLCSGGCKRQNAEKIARKFTRLTWVITDGPFHYDDYSPNFKSSTASFLYEDSDDRAAKRNFGLKFGRLVGWDVVIFMDDDVTVSKEYICKVLDLHREGASIVASNSRHYPDNSVVVAAFRESNSSTPVDAYLTSQVLLVDLKQAHFAFFPHLYNEDWLFILPYILSKDDVAWAGAVPQDRYNPFTKKRAANEEVGDLIAEGLMRLAMEVLEDSKGQEKLLDELVRRADTVFWEREILKRTVFIYNLLQVQDYAKRNVIRNRRISQSLRYSLQALLGSMHYEGLDPRAIAAWIQAWRSDLDAWTVQLKRIENGVSIDKALKELDAAERATWCRADNVGATGTKVDNYSKATLKSEPGELKRFVPAGELASTVGVESYFARMTSDLTAIQVASGRLRYDRPIRSIAGNKPTITMLIMLRVFEDETAIVRHVKNTMRWIPKAIPIHYVVWISPNGCQDPDKVEAYRDYLLSRLMLETAGANIRWLSGIGGNIDTLSYRDFLYDALQVIGLSYWKCAINTAGHPILVTNSRGELLCEGMADAMLLGVWDEAHDSLKMVFRRLSQSNLNGPALSVRDELKANELAVNRFVRNSQLAPGWRLPLRDYSRARPTKILQKALRKARLSLLEVDCMHYATVIHHAEGSDMVAKTYQVICILVVYGDSKFSVRSAVAGALAQLTTSSHPVGRTSEIMLCIRGEAAYDDLNIYRNELFAAIECYVELPAAVFMSSTIYKVNQGEEYIPERIKALIWYEHWLEEHRRMPKIIWGKVAPGQRFGLTKSIRRALGVRLLPKLLMSSAASKSGR